MPPKVQPYTHPNMFPTYNRTVYISPNYPAKFPRIHIVSYRVPVPSCKSPFLWIRAWMRDLRALAALNKPVTLRKPEWRCRVSAFKRILLHTAAPVAKRSIRPFDGYETDNEDSPAQQVIESCHFLSHQILSEQFQDVSPALPSRAQFPGLHVFALRLFFFGRTFSYNVLNRFPFRLKQLCLQLWRLSRLGYLFLDAGS